MKCTILSLLVSISAAASETPIFSILCEGSRWGTSMKLEAKSFINYSPEEMQLRDVTATWSEEGKVTVGRIDYIDTDADYKPTVYKDHMRFDLSKLTETVRFGRFNPSGCSLKLIFPPSAGNEKLKFIAPMLMSCDQSGGLMRLRCTTNKIRD